MTDMHEDQIRKIHEQHEDQIRKIHERWRYLKDTSIVTGGLMRCCTGTIFKLLLHNPDYKVYHNHKIQCAYNDSPDHTMIHRMGRIMWYREGMENE